MCPPVSAAGPTKPPVCCPDEVPVGDVEAVDGARVADHDDETADHGRPGAERVVLGHLPLRRARVGRDRGDAPSVVGDVHEAVGVRGERSFDRALRGSAPAAAAVVDVERADRSSVRAEHDRVVHDRGRRDRRRVEAALPLLLAGRRIDAERGAALARERHDPAGDDRPRRDVVVHLRSPEEEPAPVERVHLLVGGTGVEPARLGIEAGRSVHRAAGVEAPAHDVRSVGREGHQVAALGGDEHRRGIGRHERGGERGWRDRRRGRRLADPSERQLAFGRRGRGCRRCVRHLAIGHAERPDAHERGMLGDAAVRGDLVASNRTDAAAGERAALGGRVADRLGDVEPQAVVEPVGVRPLDHLPGHGIGLSSRGLPVRAPRLADGEVARDQHGWRIEHDLTGRQADRQQPIAERVAGEHLRTLLGDRAGLVHRRHAFDADRRVLQAGGRRVVGN